MKRLLSAILAIAMIAALAPVAMADVAVANDKMRLTGFTGSLRTISPTSSNGRKSIVNNVGWDGIVKTGHVIDTLALGHTVYICSSVGTGTLYNGTPDAPAADHYLYVPAGDLKANGAAKAQDGFVGWDYIESIQFEYAHITGNGTDNARWLIGATLKKYADLSPEQQAAVAAGTAKVGGKIDVTYNGDVYGTEFAFKTSNYTLTWDLSELPIDPTDYQYFKTSGGTNLNGLRIYDNYPTNKNEFRKKGGEGAVYAGTDGVITTADLGGVAYQQLHTYNNSKFLNGNAYGAPVADGSIPVPLKEYIPAGDLIASGIAAFSAEDGDNLADYIKEIKIKYYKPGSTGVNPRYWLEYTFKSEDELSSAAKAALAGGDVALKGSVTFKYTADSAVSGHNVGFNGNGVVVTFAEGDTLTIPKLDITVVETYRAKDAYVTGGAYQFRKASTTLGAVNAASGGVITSVDLGGEAYQLVFTSGNDTMKEFTVSDDGAIPAELELYIPAGELIGSGYLKFSSDSNAEDYIDSVTFKFMKSGGTGNPRYWLHYQFKNEGDLTPEQIDYLKSNGALTGSMTITYEGATGFTNGSITVDFTKSGTPKINPPATRVKDDLALNGIYTSNGAGWRTDDNGTLSAAQGMNIEVAAGNTYYTLMEVLGTNPKLNDKTAADVAAYAPAGNLLDTEYLTLSSGFAGAEYLKSVELVFREDTDRWYLKVELKSADDASLSNTEKAALNTGVALTGTMTLKHTDATYGFYNDEEGYTIDVKFGASETFGLTIKGEAAAPAVNFGLDYPYVNATTTYRFLVPGALNTTTFGLSNTAANKATRANLGESIYQMIVVNNQSKLTSANYGSQLDAAGTVPADLAPFVPADGLSAANGGLVFSGNAGDYIKDVTFKVYRNGTTATSNPRMWASVNFKTYDELTPAAKSAIGADGIKLTGTMSMYYGGATGFKTNPIVFDFDNSQASVTINPVNVRKADPMSLKGLYTASGAGWRTIVDGTMSSAKGKNLSASDGETFYTLMAINHPSSNPALNDKTYDDVKAYAPTGNLLDTKYLSFSSGFVGKEYIDAVTVEFLESPTAGQYRWYLGVSLKSADDASLSDTQKAALADGVALTGTMTLKFDDETYGFCNEDLGYDIAVKLGASEEFGLTVMHVDPYRVASFNTQYTYAMYNGLLATWTPEGETVSNVTEVTWGDAIYFLAQSFDTKYPVTDGNYVSDFEIVSIGGNLPDAIALDEYGQPDITFIRAPFRGAPDLAKYYLSVRFKEDDGTHDLSTAFSGDIVIRKTGANGFATADNTLTIPVSINLLTEGAPYTETIERTEENQKVAKFAELGYGTNKRVQTLVKDDEGNFVRRFLSNTNTAAKETPSKTVTSESSGTRVSYSGMTTVDYGETVYFMLEDAAGNRVIHGEYLDGIKITPNWLNQGQMVDKIEFVMMRYESGREGDETDYCYFLAITFVEREYSSRQQVTGEITLSGKGKHGIADTHREFINGQWVDVENKDNEILLNLDVWVGPVDSTLNSNNIKLHFFEDRKITDVDTRYRFEDPSYKDGGSHNYVGTDEEDEIYLWGTQGDCYFTVDTRGQGRIALSNNTDYDEHFGSIYGDDAELQFINGNGATFKKNGIMTISVPEDSYFIYQIKNGAVQEIPELTFDAQECAYKFRTRHLGRYMISSEELDLDKQYYFVNGYYDPNVGITEEGE